MLGMARARLCSDSLKRPKDKKGMMMLKKKELENFITFSDLEERLRQTALELYGKLEKSHLLFVSIQQACYEDDSWHTPENETLKYIMQKAETGHVLCYKE